MKVWVEVGMGTCGGGVRRAMRVVQAIRPGKKGLSLRSS